MRLRDTSQVIAALELLQTANVGFAGAFLAAAAAQEKLSMASFDRDFDKLTVPRYEPSV